MDDARYVRVVPRVICSRIVLWGRGWRAIVDHFRLLDECSAVKWKRLSIFLLTAAAAAEDIKGRA